jgi:hypothetical protein
MERTMEQRGNANLCLEPHNSPTGQKPAHGVEVEESPRPQEPRMCERTHVDLIFRYQG